MTMASRRVLSTVFMRRRANKSYGNGSGSGNGNGKVIIAGEFCSTPLGSFAEFCNTPRQSFAVLQHAAREFCNTPSGSFATRRGGILQHASAALSACRPINTFLTTHAIAFPTRKSRKNKATKTNEGMNGMNGRTNERKNARATKHTSTQTSK